MEQSQVVVDVVSFVKVLSKGLDKLLTLTEIEYFYSEDVGQRVPLAFIRVQTGFGNVWECHRTSSVLLFL